MEKDGVMNLMLRHKRFFRVAVAFFNKLPFNNSWGGGAYWMYDQYIWG